MYSDRPRCPDCGGFVPDEAANCNACGTQRIRGHDLLHDIRRVAEKIDRAPTVTDYAEHGRYSRSPVQRRFGSWNEAKRQAGVQEIKEWGIDRDRLLHDLRLVADRLGETPSSRQYDEHGQFSRSTMQDRFESWNDAIRAAGLEVNRSVGAAPTYAELTPADVGLTQGGRS